MTSPHLGSRPSRQPDSSRISAAAAAHGIDANLLVATLRELGQVERLDDLGQGGPLLASAGRDSLFHCLFGRDAIRMAFDLLEDFPAVARATLVELARLQGVGYNARADEEPGRILHEHRLDDDVLLPGLLHTWSFPYYGAVDSTPQWIALLAEYVAQEGDTVLRTQVVDRLGRTVTLLDSLCAALGWLLGRLDDPSGGGYLWVRRASPDGIANQVWEDSSDSYYHADGALFDFTRPYAPVAVQGYTYDALLGAADVLETCQRHSPPPSLPTGDSAASGVCRPLGIASLRRRAADLRARTFRDFWQPDLGTFALALTFDGPADGSDGHLAQGRPARVAASSPGHLLASQLLDGGDAENVRERLIARLFEPDLLAGAGIRTRSTTAPRFRPGSYHNGSTWPMDTGVIADGLRRHGYLVLAQDLEARILRGCALVGGFPELFRGEEDGSIALNTATIDVVQDGAVNRLEQPPQPFQGWTATRVWRILRRG